MLKLTPNPTFKAKVGIPIPGEKDVPVVFEFRHMTREELKAWVKPRLEAPPVDADAESLPDPLIAAAQEVVVGWTGIDEAFSPEALLVLFDNYPGSAFAIVQAFSDELGKARAKN